LDEAPTGDVHAETPGASDTLGAQESDCVDRGLLAQARGLLDDLEGAVAAPVEDHDHLVAARGHVALDAQRLQAGSDARRLVAGGYNDDRLQALIWWCQRGMLGERF
jgi:hypothetical protein